RTDPSFRRAQLVLAQPALGQRVDLLVIGEDQMRVAAHEQPAAIDALCGQPVELGQEHGRIDHHTVADDRGDVVVEDAARHQLQGKRLASDDDRVPRVVPALVAHDDVHLLGDEVGELALALVTPLGTDHDRCGHGAMVVNHDPRAGSQNDRDVSTPEVSVVVPMRNAAEHVLEQVTALANQSAGEVDFEVIWVDNGSSDDTLQLVSDSIRGDDRMRVISAPEVRSSYFARNQGVAAAKGDLVLFCDADDVVDKHWIQSMVTALADLDVVGGSLKFGIDEAATVETAPVHAFLPAARTANLGARKDAFETLGGFNGSMRSGEDWAFCWRAQLAG